MMVTAFEPGSCLVRITVKGGDAPQGAFRGWGDSRRCASMVIFKARRSEWLSTWKTRRRWWPRSARWRRKALSVVAAEYRGLTVSQMTELRSKARAAGVYVRVVKNTLARKAVAGTSFECLGPVLKGPLGAGLLEGRSGRGGARGQGLREGQRQAGHDGRCRSAGNCSTAKDLDRVASLPTREQALAMLMGVMKAPIQKLVGTLAAAPSKLVRTLAAVRDQKQAAAA